MRDNSDVTITKNNLFHNFYQVSMTYVSSKDQATLEAENVIEGNSEYMNQTCNIF